MQKKTTRKYYRFDMDMKLMNILAMILYFIFFIYLYSNTYFNKFDFSFMAFIGLFIYFFLHEICHGIGYSVFAKDKKNIKYGAILEKGVFYAMCQEEISKKGIVISLLFPIFILTLIPLPFAFLTKSSLLLFYAISNLIGAIGDIAMLTLVFHLPSDTTYIDYDNNLGAYFVSEYDLSQIKSWGLKCSTSAIHDEKKIDKTIKRIYISPASRKYFLIFCIILLILFVVNMI